MGWQDDPEVAAPPQPKWAQDPEVAPTDPRGGARRSLLSAFRLGER
jgi:hypothetical protein